MATFLRSLVKTWVCFALVFAALVCLHSLTLGPRKANGTADRKLRIALFVNGALGDKSFFDSAAQGLRQARDSLGVETRVIEGGADPTRWPHALRDIVEGGEFDMVITGTFTIVPIIEQLAPAFPDTRFIVFDATVNYAKCACGNVHSMLFRQNEGAYLAGFLAGKVALAQAGKETPPRVGVIGGMQIPVIDDFVIGFTAGAKAASDTIQVTRQYVNSFSDPATAKEIAGALFKNGARVIFQAAGGSGHGVVEAAADAQRLVIGVDLDQYALYKSSSPALAAGILTSVLKNVDVALVRAIQAQLAGQLKYGAAETLGLAEKGVSLAEGSPGMRGLSTPLLGEMARVQHEVETGRIRVASAFAMAGQAGSPP